MHHVIVAYYPIQPRWGLPACPYKNWIGDPIRQYPLLGLYNNTTDTEVIRFDFKALKSAGVTVVNVHLFGGFDQQLELMERINSICLQEGLFWTPTYEEGSLTHDPVALSAHTNATIAHFGPGSAFFRDTDGNCVVFWYLYAKEGLSRDANAQRVAHGIELLRANSGQVNVYLDDNNCSMGQPCQSDNGTSPISHWFSDGDNQTGKRRVQGFYAWVSVFWAMKPNRAQVAANYVNTSANHGFRPVISTTPSYNEENWGYSNANTGPNPGNCGICGDRTRQPCYNAERDPHKWAQNLDAALGNANAQTWLYIQAYDEWGEGTTLAPNTYNHDSFLSELKKALNRHGWLTDSSAYELPPIPNTKTIRSVVFPNVYLRMDAHDVTQSAPVGGMVNCQNGVATFERLYVDSLGDGIHAIRSSWYPNVHLRMDGTGVTQSTPIGGTVNCHFEGAAWERFRIVPQEDSTVAFESVAFPGVYLRMDGSGLAQPLPGGGGTVNCHLGVSSWERFHLG